MVLDANEGDGSADYLVMGANMDAKPQDDRVVQTNQGRAEPEGTVRDQEMWPRVRLYS